MGEKIVSPPLKRAKWSGRAYTTDIETARSSRSHAGPPENIAPSPRGITQRALQLR